MGKSTLDTYKEGTWQIFSLYIRARDANKEGFFRCCTCPRVLFWRGSESQAGHYVPGRGNMVLFDERIVHAQCYYCNQPLGGNQWEYTKFMLSKGYTQEQLEQFHALRHIPKKYTKEELKVLKFQFKQKLDNICTQKGLIL